MGAYSPIIVALALSFVGCGKKEAEATAEAPTPTAEEPAAAAPATTKPAAAAATPAAAENLPGENEIRAALDRKDYMGSLDRLIALRGVAQAGGKWFEYRQLAADIGERLVEAAQKDPNAVPALNGYRQYMAGQ